MSKPAFTTEAFAAWLASKDPNETYDYTDCTNCCVAQYLRSLGMLKVYVGGCPPGEMYTFHHFDGKTLRERALPYAWASIASGFGRDDNRGDRTFGAALERAEEYMAGTVH